MSTKKPGPTPSKEWRQASREQLATDIAAGLSNEEMAEKYYVSESTVKVYLTRYGLRRRQENIPRPTNEQMLECLRRKMSVREIARRFSVAENWVCNQIRWNHLREEVQPSTANAPATAPARSPSPTVFIDERGVSLWRVPTIHGAFVEVRP